MKFEGFIGPSYMLEAPSANAQRTVNLYLETQEAGTRKANVMRLVGTPGLCLLGGLGTGPVRGVYWSSTNQLFVVSGENLWEVVPGWGMALRPGSIGSSVIGRVTMADNGTTLMIGDGTATAWNAALAAGSALSAVSDPDCPGGYVAWQDGYFINTVPGTNRFQISGINNVAYDPLDVASKEGRPDNIVMALVVNRQLWLFGEQTTEVWWNSGAALFPFERVDGAFIETGTISALTCCRVANSVAWLGNDERGRGTVWYAQGYQLQRISTHAVEQALSGYGSLADSFAFAYRQNGHEFYQLTVPPSITDSGGTWVFDFACGQWHERSYLDPIKGALPHLASCATSAYGAVVAGDRNNGNLYLYDLATYTDNGSPIRRLRQSPHLSSAEKRIRHNAFELQAESGVGLQSGQGSAPLATLSWSDDGGHTWGNGHTVSMGMAGQYKNRYRWRRLGVARDRVYRVETSEPVKITWLGAELELEQLER